MPIDLHSHTRLSDGADTSTEMTQKHIEKGSRLIATTDHDIVNREVPAFIKDFHATITGLVFQQMPYIDVVEGTEVSVGHKESGYEKSLHVTVYSRGLPPDLDTFLESIRDGKSEKIKLQCQTLADHGFQIALSTGMLVPFTLANLLARFPGSRADNLNNGHIKDVLVGVPENEMLLQKITNGEVRFKNFMMEGLKREGRFTKLLSLPHEVPSYEPIFESLIAELDIENTVISLPHANVTFRTVEEFQKRIGRFVDLGLSALEINATAPAEWVETILRTREKYGLLLTFGSDSHGIGKTDKYHGELGSMNPHIDSIPEGVEHWKDEFLLRTNGYAYRMMKSGDFS